MFFLTLLADLMALVGLVYSLHMVVVAMKRSERIVRTAPTNAAAIITVRRTIRTEITFVIAHAAILVASMTATINVSRLDSTWGMTVLVSCFARIVVSGALLINTIEDELDRHRLHDILNLQQAKSLERDLQLLEAQKVIPRSQAELLEDATELGFDVGLPDEPETT